MITVDITLVSPIVNNVHVCLKNTHTNMPG